MERGTQKPIRVLIVDDSALIRELLSRLISAAPDMEVVGMATDPYVARELFLKLRPDVITLDIEMPRMDGLTFLNVLMEHFPTPVVVISSLAKEGSDKALEALARGAVAVACKPNLSQMGEFGPRLIRSIRDAAGAQPARQRLQKSPPAPTVVRRVAPVERPGVSSESGDLSDHLLAIGASTGGTVAIETILRQLPARMPGIVIVQHMPPNFTGAFARRLDALCALETREAQDGDVIAPGTVLIAPGDSHMTVERRGRRYLTRLHQGAPVQHQRPSVDVLFRSVAEQVGDDATGVILTGMGADGAQGLLEMHKRGARTLAQDEKSCVVYGMPRAAVELGAVDEVLSLQELASTLTRLSRPTRRLAG